MKLVLIEISWNHFVLRFYLANWNIQNMYLEMDRSIYLDVSFSIYITCRSKQNSLKLEKPGCHSAVLFSFFHRFRMDLEGPKASKVFKLSKPEVGPLLLDPRKYLRYPYGVCLLLQSTRWLNMQALFLLQGISSIGILPRFKIILSFLWVSLSFQMRLYMRIYVSSHVSSHSELICILVCGRSWWKDFLDWVISMSDVIILFLSSPVHYPVCVPCPLQFLIKQFLSWS